MTKMLRPYRRCGRAVGRRRVGIRGPADAEAYDSVDGNAAVRSEDDRRVTASGCIGHITALKYVLDLRENHVYGKCLLARTPEETHMGTLDGKVAFITGAARGQGRSHAVTLAEEGANIIAVDICAEATSVDYEPATPADLEQTAKLVEALGRRIVARRVDVRDSVAMAGVAAEGAEELGGLDIVVANAGVVNWARFWEMADQQWRDVIDINLTGVFNTLKAAAPIMIAQGRGGAIVITSSSAGIKSLPAQAHYSASKHGVVGLMKTAAIELAPFNIRVNTVHPWGVDTPMGVFTEDMQKIVADNPSYAMFYNQLLNDPPIAAPRDISEAVLYLVSASGRLVTGIELPVDSGATRT